MKIFYLKFKVKPTLENLNFNIIEGAYVLCWIKEWNSKNAFAIAEYIVSKDEWIISDVEKYPLEVNESDFSDKGPGLENFLKAKSEGRSIVFLGKARDGKTTLEPFQVNKLSNFPPISEFLDSLKKLSQKGRCLHYEKGDRCNNIIKAHSIQKSQSLSSIAQDAHVYVLSNNYGDFNKNNGLPTYTKKSINKVSTFMGFCQIHDNELFELIDNNFLIPTDQQVLLYAYRSLCREVFVSENALTLVNEQLEKKITNFANKKLLSFFKKGKDFGFNNLIRHKMLYDESLGNKSFSDIKYVILNINQKPIIAFSGVFYPDYDFLGNQLQNLGNHKIDLELMTFCSAPTEKGWAFIFAWHETSSKICKHFMRSLATITYKTNYDYSDHLFRLAIMTENHAISPKWWDGLEENVKQKITERASILASPFSAPDQFYLNEGLEGAVNWKVDSVVSNMD